MTNTLDKLRSRMKDVKEGKAPLAQGEQPLIVHRAVTMAISAEELKAAVALNPKHPVAKAYAKALSSGLGNAAIAVDQTDLEALLENKEVYTEAESASEEVAGMALVTNQLRKKLRDFPAEATTPATPARDDDPVEEDDTEE